MSKIGVPILGLSEWFGGDVSEHENKTEVRTYRVTMTCPECGNGEMRFTGHSWPTADPGYHHKCTNDECGYICAIRGHQYPETRTEPIQ